MLCVTISKEKKSQFKKPNSLWEAPPRLEKQAEIELEIPSFRG